ncbi:hypothetical protein KI387_026106 [Taxus chinensis]|uniref:GDSL esterase/lipase n=1 Tax=Taxus chinensis TaxID=29808 RepID=A0AA38FV66_TAXCH|nr:hypothetical protein KI387_026106 [Taxus chinensis]
MSERSTEPLLDVVVRWSGEVEIFVGNRSWCPDSIYKFQSNLLYMDSMLGSALFMVTILNLFAGKGSAEMAEALFVFGDSFADTGNRDPYNQTLSQSWRRPYGLTWPGYPAGRFSSGKIQTDFWGDILGLPCPVSYELLKSHDCETDAEKIRQGVNFAVGGSGIFRAHRFTTVPEQVKQFKKLIAASSGFDSLRLSRSVALISAAGNDYANNGSNEGLVDLVEPVVSGTIEVVKDLYESGLRNFVVSNVAPFGCAPQIGKTSCDSKYDDTINLHTKLLTEGVHHLRSNLKGLSIIISDLVSAFHHIFSHSTQYGFEDIFMPCCAVKGGVNMCTEVDERGRALFEVCDNVDNKFFWDFGHPTHRGWYEVMSLYAYGAHEGNRKLNFIEGASNAIEWVQSLGFLAHNISLQSATAVL